MSKPNDLIRPLLDDRDAMHLIGLFAKAGFEMRFIGGCVRDALMGFKITEIDLAASSLPGETVAVLQKNGLQAVPTGFEHGTVTAVLNGRHFEITTLRADVKTDGRHAEVAFSKDWKTDAERRDFTVNALSVDAEGELYDYLSGIADLEKKRLVFIGDPARRIQEDYLRILRFFRFSSQLNWKIQDDKQLTLCTAYTPQLKTLSRERIQSELLKLLMGQGALKVVLTMRSCGIWKGLIDTGLDVDAFGNMVFLENKHNEPDALRRLIALIGLNHAEQIDKVAVLSNKEKKRLQELLAIDEYRSDNRSLTRQLYDYGPAIVKDYYYLQNSDKHFAAIDAWQKPVFPIKAADVLPWTGGEGPLVGVVLKALENYWLDDSFKTPRDELLIMAKHFVENEA